MLAEGRGRSDLQKGETGGEGHGARCGEDLVVSAHEVRTLVCLRRLDALEARLDAREARTLVCLRRLDEREGRLDVCETRAGGGGGVVSAANFSDEALPFGHNWGRGVFQ